ncbi:hypothetical protein NDU88_004651 [Pleurodeles waltl]|uniref:Uncharacterized protein n=1 Tax=Pleurodeles waltl TaxID=8319 RepID=A0AAV7W9Q1_PLEWA|nr:hypothetical protein NDU88_004651 [Pleurodeles waltl]
MKVPRGHLSKQRRCLCRGGTALERKPPGRPENDRGFKPCAYWYQEEDGSSRRISRDGGICRWRNNEDGRRISKDGGMCRQEKQQTRVNPRRPLGRTLLKRTLPEMEREDTQRPATFWEEHGPCRYGVWPQRDTWRRDT